MPVTPATSVLMPLSDSSGAPETRLVSENGGLDPVWGADGTELFFRDPEGRLMSASVDVRGGAAAPELGAPETVLDLRALELNHDESRMYDVLPDGSGFVFSRRQGTNQAVSRIYVVLDWLAELERTHPLGE